MEKISGIYSITNTVNGKRYVGSTVNYHRRISQHFHDLRNGKHRNCHLQYAFNKYGESFFVAALIESVPIELLLNTEQKHLDENKDGYNIAKYADSPSRGMKRSQEHMSKLSIAGMGHIVSKEVRDILSAVNKGKVLSQETRQKMSKAKKGLKKSPETRAKLSASMMGHVFSQETKDKMSASHKGKVLPQETRLKMSASRKGIALSPERRAKIRDGRRKYFENIALLKSTKDEI